MVCQKIDTISRGMGWERIAELLPKPSGKFWGIDPDVFGVAPETGGLENLQ